jgi:hypothetical protein
VVKDAHARIIAEETKLNQRIVTSLQQLLKFGVMVSGSGRASSINDLRTTRGYSLMYELVSSCLTSLTCSDRRHTFDASCTSSNICT